LAHNRSQQAGDAATAPPAQPGSKGTIIIPRIGDANLRGTVGEGYRASPAHSLWPSQPGIGTGLNANNIGVISGPSISGGPAAAPAGAAPAGGGAASGGTTPSGTGTGGAGFTPSGGYHGLMAL